jgi:hypothetical protein
MIYIQTKELLRSVYSEELRSQGFVADGCLGDYHRLICMMNPNLDEYQIAILVISVYNDSLEDTEYYFYELWIKYKNTYF